jgi:molecular chaperone GrpE
VSSKRDEEGQKAEEQKEGSEPLAEEPSGGSVSPSPELEEALREATEAVETRQAEREGGEAEEGEAAEAEALRGELTALQEQMVRLQADFDNFRRRALKEREEAHRYGHENLVKDLLATVDNLDRAIEHARTSDGGDFESMLQGVELVQRELLGALANHGVSEIEAGNVPFDPNVHEAMAQREDDSVPVNTAIEVLQKGYRLRDRLLRPARVIVSTQAEGADEGEAEAAEE